MRDSTDKLGWVATKRKAMSFVAIAAICAPMIASAPPLPQNKHNAVVHPGIRYELQIGAEKYEVSHERDGYTTAQGAIINTDGVGYFVTVKSPHGQD